MEKLKIYKKVGSGLKIIFIAFLLRMVMAFFNIDDLGKMVNFFLEPVEKILILAGFLVAGSAVHKYRWGALFMCLEFFTEFLAGFVSNLIGNDILTVSIYNSTVLMTFARICVLCIVTGAMLRKEEEDGIYKHGMFVIGMYAISTGYVILTILSYSLPWLAGVVSVLAPIYIITFVAVFVYGVYLGRSYLFFDHFIEDNERSELNEE